MFNELAIEQLACGLHEVCKIMGLSRTQSYPSSMELLLTLVTSGRNFNRKEEWHFIRDNQLIVKSYFFLLPRASIDYVALLLTFGFL